MDHQPQANDAARQFQTDGEPARVVPYGSGHINDTYRVTVAQAGDPAHFLLQRINTGIFHDPATLMENIERVTSHVAAQLSNRPDRSRRVLSLVRTRDGLAWHQDSEAGSWRMYRFIDGAHTYDTVSSAAQAFAAAKAFGEFQKMLADLPAPRLHDTIPGFHNTPQRYNAFEGALATNVAGRASLASAEIKFAVEHQSISGALLNARLPERVIHNDTKFNNILFDDKTGEGLCVVDLDTVMPGLALYDFGDMVRTATSDAGEDEQDLRKVGLQFHLFEALLRGYLTAAGSFLGDEEKRYLAFAGKLITFEQGLRFLTDYLGGDTYYKVHRNNHNLDRCRTQFKLVASIEQQEEKMNTLLNELLSR